MHIKNRYKLFKIGEDKFTKEFDAEYFARTMRKVHMLLTATMDEHERHLTSYQQYNAIRLDNKRLNEESDEDGDPDYEHKIIPKLGKESENEFAHNRKVAKFMVN